MVYRPEIDGLRAIAVLTVIFFHAGFDWMSGGFIGVDVFFVISGYLITGIILTELQNKTFTLQGFYERRARRILPALYLVLFITIPLSWILMLPHQLKDYFQTLFAVNISSSNILFWYKSGYFNTASDLKPLLHTWSLAVEEQFYLLFPTFVLACLRFNYRFLVWSVSLIALVSFGLAEWRWGMDQDAAFYLIFTRVWELAFGALLALMPATRERLGGYLITRELLVLLALLGILASAVVYSESTHFPGLAALVPTLGAGIMIRYGKGTFVARHFLSSPPMVLIGLISYSAYLWHQPIFAFTRLIRINVPSITDYLIGIGVTLMLALLSWKYLETVIRSPQRVGPHAVWIMVVVGSAFFIGVGLLGSLSGGFPHRLNEQASHVYKFKDSKAKNVKNCYGYVESRFMADAPVSDLGGLCRLGSAGKPVIGLMGDSHATTMSLALSEALQRLSLPGVDLTYNSCPPLDAGEADQERHSTKVCLNFRNWMFENPGALPDTLILMARWPLMLEGKRFDNGEGGVESGSPFKWRDLRTKRVYSEKEILSIYESSITRLLALGKKVVLVYGTPEMGWDVPDRLARFAMRNAVTEEAGSTSYSRYLERNLAVINLFDSIGERPGLYRVRPDSEFCNAALAGRCEAHTGGNLLYYDDDHLSLQGAQRLMRLIEPILVDIHYLNKVSSELPK